MSGSGLHIAHQKTWIKKMKNIVEIVINSLKPNMHDWVENRENGYWFAYEDALDWFSHLKDEDNDFIKSINYTLRSYISSSASHHAATDVALTLESLAPEQYAGKFVYN